MTAIRSFEDIHDGQELPTLEREVHAQQLIRFAGAANDYSRPHWDHQYMVSQGFPGVIVHGWLTVSILCQVVSSWVPLESADFKTYSVRYLEPSRPGRARYGGRVTRKYLDDGAKSVELEVWATSLEGARLATSTITLAFA